MTALKTILLSLLCMLPALYNSYCHSMDLDYTEEENIFSAIYVNQEGFTCVKKESKLEKLLLHAVLCPQKELLLKIIKTHPEIANTWLTYESLLCLTLRDCKNIDCIKILLDAHANIDKDCWYIAIKTGRIDIIKLLLEAGADINMQSDTNTRVFDVGATPLCYALDNAFVEISLFLIEAGADVNLKTFRNKTSPLHIASRCGYEAIVKTLLAHGAKKTIQDKDEWGRTPLHYAARIGCPNAIKLLISAGAQSNEQDNEGNTPLHFATEHFREILKREDIDNMRMENFKAATATILIFDAEKKSVLEYRFFLQYDYNATIELLFASGAKANIFNAEKKSPLHFALARGADIRVIQNLLAHGAEETIQNKDSDGYTPLHFAARGDDCNIVRLLISAGAKVNEINNCGDSPLHIAARCCYNIPQCDHAVIIRDLIIAGAQINILNDQEKFPLHYAVEIRNIKAIQELIAAGAIFEESFFHGHEVVPRLTANSASPEVLALIADYDQRIIQARQLAKPKSKAALKALALATHSRLSSESPARGLHPYLLQYMAQFVFEAVEEHEVYKARQPRTSQTKTSSWCIIS